LPIGGATIIQYAALFDMAGFAHGLPQREHPPRREAWEPLLCQFILLDLKQPLGATRVRTVQERVGMPRTIPCLELQLHALFSVSCQICQRVVSCCIHIPSSTIIYPCVLLYMSTPLGYIHSPRRDGDPSRPLVTTSAGRKVGALGSSSELS